MRERIAEIVMNIKNVYLFISINDVDKIIILYILLCGAPTHRVDSFTMVVLLVRLTVLTVLAGACQGINVDASSAGGWEHDWNSPASAWWGYGGLANRGLTDEQVEMVANTYKIVVLSMWVVVADIFNVMQSILCVLICMRVFTRCVGDLNVSVSETLRNISMRLKAVTPTIKVIQYFNVELWACYEASDPWYVPS